MLERGERYGLVASNRGDNNSGGNVRCLDEVMETLHGF